MNIHDSVVADLRDARGRWPEVAAGAGVPLRTIEKIARREISNPGVSHIIKLADYFRVKAARRGRRAA